MPFLRNCLLDTPNNRSSHNLPTPRGGGISFVLVSSLSCLIAYFLFPETILPEQNVLFAPLICLPLAVVGLIDDFCDLPAFFRFFVQTFTSFFVISLSPLLPSYHLLLFLFLAISFVAIVNFTNFMDGIDGLVSGCMSVAITVSLYSLDAPSSSWALIGSLFAFVFWNWSPAKVFMGDVGSTFLGALFAFLVLQSASWQQSFSLLLVASPLLADACFCVVRRLVDGQSVFQAHRLHLFQRLHQAGWSHGRVSSLYLFSTVILGLSFLLGGLSFLIPFTLLLIVIGIWLDQNIAVPFSLPS